MGEPLDAHDGVNTAVEGVLLAGGLGAVLKKEGIRLPEPVNVLFLGAGSAKAELAYVTELGLDLGQVTLVDRYDELRRTKLQEAGFGAVVNGDLFDFMRMTRDKFSLVTGLGIEYVVETDPARFFDLVSGVVKPGGIVYLSAPPYIEEDSWENRGFREIGGRARLILVKN
jgi:SAM-dependent methyltransferase